MYLEDLIGLVSSTTIWRQHARILKAIVAGDAMLAEELAIARIRHAVESLAAVFSDEIATDRMLPKSATTNRSQRR